MKKLDTIGPTVETIRIIGSEPKLLVLKYLLDGGKGFNELQRLTRLSSKTLSSILDQIKPHSIALNPQTGLSFNSILDQIKL